MTAYGETSTGFRGKTYDEALSELKARFRSRISEELTLDEYDWLGNVVAICADREQLVWEALEVARNQFDPDNAEGNLAIGIAAITGTRRKDATKGTVTCSLTLDANKTFAPGALVAHVEGQPDNRWVNRDTVTSTSAGVYFGQVFVAETAGKRLALTGKLKVIAQTASGWLAISNPADATPGADIESIPDLMVRREEELGAGGNATVAAIDKAVSAVSGVIEAKVFYNDTGSPIVNVVSLPANSIRVVVWDGTVPAASNNDIAKAIFETKSAGCLSIGLGSSPATGTTTDLYGTTKTVDFARANSFSLSCAITVQAPIGTNTTQLTADIKQSIIDLWPNKIGASVYASKLAAGPASLDAVLNVQSIFVGAPPTNPSATAAADQIFLISSGSITVTINLI